MLLCPMKVLTELIPTVIDKKYKKLLENQISSINSDRDSLLKRIKRFYRQYHLNHLSPKFLKRCCDFDLLEDKSKEYIKRYLNKN